MNKRFSVIIAALFIFGGCATKQESIKGSDSVNYSSIQSKMVAYVNSIRQKGVTCSPPSPPLKYNSNLEQAAQAHAKDMALNNKLSHTGSGTATDPAKSAIGVGSSHIDRILYFGFPKKVGSLVGENITYTKFKIVGSDDYMANFKKAIKNIINDRVHCEIFMNPRFTDVGMGMYKSDDRYYFVMDLGESKGEVKAQPKKGEYKFDH